MEKLYGKQLEIMATKARLLGLDAVHTAASGHIGGSRNLPLELLPAAAPRELPDRGAPLYVYCRSGGRSRRAAALLKRMGYTNVTDIGGIADYRGRVVR